MPEDKHPKNGPITQEEQYTFIHFRRLIDRIDWETPMYDEDNLETAVQDIDRFLNDEVDANMKFRLIDHERERLKRVIKDMDREALRNSSRTIPQDDSHSYTEQRRAPLGIGHYPVSHPYEPPAANQNDREAAEMHETFMRALMDEYEQTSLPPPPEKVDLNETRRVCLEELSYGNEYDWMSAQQIYALRLLRTLGGANPKPLTPDQTGKTGELMLEFRNAARNPANPKENPLEAMCLRQSNRQVARTLIRTLKRQKKMTQAANPGVKN